MSIYEKTAVLLGVLGFFLGIVNLLMNYRYHRPNLRVITDNVCYFIVAKSKNRSFIEHAYVGVIDIRVSIYNTSSKNNTVIGLEFFSDAKISDIDKKQIYGLTRPFSTVINISTANCSILGFSEWGIPKQYFEVLPQPIGVGDVCKLAVTLEVGSDITGDDISVNIKVKDANARVYKTKAIAHYTTWNSDKSIPITIEDYLASRH
jgi:hypothetical protein